MDCFKFGFFFWGDINEICDAMGIKLLHILLSVVWQLDDAKKSRGERVEDGTAQRDRPLFEVLTLHFLFLFHRQKIWTLF